MKNTWASFIIGAFAAYYIHDKYEIVFPILLCMVFIGVVAYLIWKRPLAILGMVLGLIIFSLLYHQIDNRTDFLKNSNRLVGTGVVGEKGSGRIILRQVQLPGSKKSFSIAVYGIDNLEDFKCGQKVEFRGLIKGYRPRLGYLDIDEEKHDLSRGVDARIKSNLIRPTGKVNRYYYLTGAVKEKLADQLDRIFSTNLATILKSMLLNDLLPEEFFTLYEEAGLIHLFAISGLHMGLWFLVFSEIFRFIPINYYTKQVFVFLLLFALLFFLGFPPGAFRVWFMLLFIHIGKLLKYHVAPFHSLCFAAAMMVVWRPYSFYNDGFVMSFLAIAGIYGPASYLQPKLSFLGKYLSSALATSLGVTLCLLPYLVEYQLFLSPWMILLNVLLIPVYSLIFIGGALTLALSFLSLNLIHFLTVGLEGLTNLSLGIIQLAREGFLPIYLPVLNSHQKLTYYFLIYLGIQPKTPFNLKYENLVWLQFLLVFLIQSLYHRHTQADLKITMPYVDQGDAILIESKDYCALVDTGGSHIDNYDPTKRYLLPHFNAKGITRIDDIFISHGDSDHMGGLDTIKSQVPVHQIYSNQGLAPKRDDITYIDKLNMTRGDLDIHAIPLPSLEQDENDNSIPLLITYKNFKALFMGDLSTRVEKKILDELPQVTLLKVGHHGSKTSTSEDLLAKCQPKLGIISAGYRNIYGHPNEEVLDRLDRYGVTSLVTQWDGTIEIYIRGDHVYIETYRQQAKEAIGIWDLLTFGLAGYLALEMINYIKRERGGQIEPTRKI